MCRRYCIKQEFTNAKSPELNGVAERALGIIQNATLAARIHAPILFPHVVLPPSETLWTEAIHWAYEAEPHRDDIQPGQQVAARGVVRRGSTCITAPVPSSGVLPLGPHVEVILQVRE